MRSVNSKVAGAAIVVSFALVAVFVAPSGAQPPPGPSDRIFNSQFETPVLGMNAIPGRNEVVVADAGQGIVRVGRSSSRLVTFMPGVADVLALNGNRMFAITGEPPEEDLVVIDDGALQVPPPRAQTVYRVERRGAVVRPLANLWTHESRKNPDGGAKESNPFDIDKVGRNLVVADAAANDALLVHVRTGKVRTMATFPQKTVTTRWLKDAVGCPSPQLPPELAELCDLPPEMSTDPVPTSVAVGPDGYVYFGELSGFPAGPGSSNIWRVKAGARNVECGVDPACELVMSGFTSIVDLGFTSDGRLAVAEFDRATFIAAEAGQGIGGAVSICDLATQECDDVATNLQLLTSIAIRRDDRILASVWGLVPGSADIVLLPAA